MSKHGQSRVQNFLMFSHQNSCVSCFHVRVDFSVFVQREAMHVRRGRAMRPGGQFWGFRRSGCASRWPCGKKEPYQVPKTPQESHEGADGANSMAACQAKEDAELEACIEKASTNKILFASGPPGTGKTHVIHEQIVRWKQQGARILFTVPTGQLASEQKAIHPDIHVDTYHGAFLLHRTLQEAMAILTQYELVILDEASVFLSLCRAASV